MPINRGMCSASPGTKKYLFSSKKKKSRLTERFVRIGFEKATSQVAEVLQNQRPIYQHIVVMGFSVGATVAWLLAGYTGLCDGSVGYYGSRIRHYTNIIPKVPALLLYGQSEPAFDLSALLQTLARTPEVILEQYPALHGFSNPYSSHYQPVAASLADEDVQQFLDNLTR